WLGMVIVVLMGIAYMVSTVGLAALMVAPAVFAFGLVAFGFLGMGPVTIAVDSYAPVTDNAQSIFELTLTEQTPKVKKALKRDQGLGDRQQEGRRDLHAVCAERHVQHLPHRVLLDPGLRLPGALLLHRLPDVDRALRALPGGVHGQRGRRVG